MKSTPSIPDTDKHHELTLHTVLRAIAEFLSLLIVLSLVNALVSRTDPGWLALNPTPFLLVPAILGVRYGFAAGLLSGALTAGLITLARLAIAELPVADHRFVLASLPLLGLIVGQFSEFLRRRSSEQALATQDLRVENRVLRAERQLLFLAKQDLQQRLGLYGANSASLDQDIEELAACDRRSAPGVLLSTLQRLTRVRSAAVYELTNARTGNLARHAVIGDAGHFPETLRGSEHHLVKESLQRRCFLTQKGLLQATPARAPGFLLASPITDANGDVNFVLIVQDLPFTEISRRNFSTIKAICDWFATFVISPVNAPARHRAVSQTDFFKAIETAITTHTEHALPSTLVRIPFNGTPCDAISEAFGEFLDSLPGPAILTNAIEDGQRSLLFLFPTTAGSELGAAFRNALQAFARRLGVPAPPAPRFHLTQPDASPQQLWGQLITTS
jgi:hypothetical protein